MFSFLRIALDSASFRKHSIFVVREIAAMVCGSYFIE